MTTSERDLSLDVLKTLAIFFVIMIHMTAPGFVSFGPQWPSAVFYESISRISVPIFFMVTGATLLQKNNNVASIMRRVRHILIPLLGWSVIYIAYNTHFYHQSTHGWLKSIIQGPVRHLWYLYTLVGIYIFLPILSRFYQCATSQEKIWILGAWFTGASIMPLFRNLTNQPLIGIDMSYLPIYGGYLILGAYLYEQLTAVPVGNRWILVFVLTWAIGAALTLAFTFYKTITDNHFTTIFLDYYSPTVVLASAGAFCTVVSFSRHYRSLVPRKTVTLFGERTLGIYLCHMILLDYTPGIISYMGPMGSWLWYFLCTLLTVILSLVLVMIIQRIPFLRAICP